MIDYVMLRQIELSNKLKMCCILVYHKQVMPGHIQHSGSVFSVKHNDLLLLQRKGFELNCNQTIRA